MTLVFEALVNMLVKEYGGCTPLMISYGTWLMYMGVVHHGHTIWYIMYLVDVYS
jgi:hypothetical protein